MSAQSFLMKLGQRLGTLGLPTNLACAFPLAEGAIGVDAHTDASRIGWYASRAAGVEKMGFVVMGTESFSVNAAGIAALGLTLTNALGVAYGGTGATTAANARLNLSAAASGANSDITSLSGLLTPLSVGQGGTGASTAAGARANLGAAPSTVATHAVYLAKHGNDSNSGLDPEAPKLTWPAALIAASALSPSSSKQVVIVVQDAGTYDADAGEDGLIPAYVSLDAPFATFTPASSGVGGFVLDCAGSQSIRVYAILGDFDAGSCIRLGGSNISVTAQQLTPKGGYNAVETTGVNYLYCDLLESKGGGWGIIDTGGIYAEVQKVILYDNSSFFDGYTGSTLDISEIGSAGTPSGQIGFRLTGGDYDFMLGWVNLQGAGSKVFDINATSRARAYATRCEGVAPNTVAAGGALDLLVADSFYENHGITVDGAGSVITPGIKGDWSAPFDGEITAWRILSDQAGDCVFDLWKDTYANAPPTVADTITAAAKPTLSASDKADSSTLTGWTTQFSRGDVIRFNVDSAATITRVTLALRVRRTRT